MIHGIRRCRRPGAPAPAGAWWEGSPSWGGPRRRSCRKCRASAPDGGYPANAGFPSGDTARPDWSRGTRPPFFPGSPPPSRRCYAAGQSFPSRRLERVERRGPTGRGGARPPPGHMRPGARNAGAGQGRIGCAISREARRTASAAARTSTLIRRPTHRGPSATRSRPRGARPRPRDRGVTVDHETDVAAPKALADPRSTSASPPSARRAPLPKPTTETPSRSRRRTRAAKAKCEPAEVGPSDRRPKSEPTTGG